MSAWTRREHGPQRPLCGLGRPGALLLALCGVTLVATPASAYVFGLRGQPQPHVAALRALLVSDPEGGSSTWLQVALEPPASAACWLQPIQGHVDGVEARSGRVLDVLRAETAPRSLDFPRNQYGQAACGGEGGDDLQAVPLGHEWVSYRAELQPTALDSEAQARQWLEAEGCVVASSDAEAIAGLAAAGWEFVAVVLPAHPAGDEPVGWPRVVDQALWVSSDAPAGLHWGRAASADPRPATERYVWTVGPARPVLQGRRLFEVQAPPFYRPESFEVMYARLLDEQWEAAGPEAVALEYAARLSDTPPLAAALAAALDAGAVGLGAGRGFVARLHARAPPAGDDRPLRVLPGSDERPFRVRVIASAGGALGILLVFLLAALLAHRRSGQRPHSAGGSTGAGGRPGALLLLLALGAASSVSGGCLSTGGLRSAEITPRGETDLLFAAAAARDPRHDLDREAPVPEGTTTPRGVVPALGLSRGLGAGYDLAAWVYPIGSRLELRRSLLDGGAAGELSLTVGAAGSVLWDPLQGERCLQRQPDDVLDGCYREQRWGAAAEVPVTLSQHLGAVSWYAGAKLGVLWLRSDLEYSDPADVFASLDVSKETWRLTTGVFGGVELKLGAGFGLIPELQVLTSVNDARRLVFYVVPGLGLRWRI